MYHKTFKCPLLFQVNAFLQKKEKLWLPQFKLSIFTVCGDQIVVWVMFNTYHILVMNLKLKKQTKKTFSTFYKL